MRRVSLQAARWHQHGIHRSLINHARSGPPHFRRPFTVRSRLSAEDDKLKTDIRYFEQVSPQSKRRIEVDPTEDDNERAAYLKAQIRELENELAVLKEGPYGPNSDFMRSLSEEDRTKVLEALRKYEAEEGKNTEQEEDDGFWDDKELDAELNALVEESFGDMLQEEKDMWDVDKPVEAIDRKMEERTTRTQRSKEPFEIQIRVLGNQQAYIDRFNKSLVSFSKDTSKVAAANEVWKWYRRCKQTVPTFLQLVSEETAAMLWKSQLINQSSHAPRMVHLKTLVDDILLSGRHLTGTQWLTYIQTLRNEGIHGAALDLWKKHKDDLVPDEMNDYEYLTFGVDLYTAQGEPAPAQDLALKFLQDTDSQNPRILVPIIAAWARLPGEQSVGKAWALYLRLKTLLGTEMTMEDYDNISVGFLRARRADFALAVFKDMMLTGENSANDSTALYKASLGLMGNLHASSISESEVNKVSLSALTILPRRFQNKFFYASWLKKLIGMREVDSAAQVVELMYERGVKPDPKHLNGIVGAWLREGNAISRDKAERLGWAMVQERIDQVWARYTAQPSGESSAKPSVYDTTNGLRIPKFMQRRVPPANIETFSILLLHYSRRSQEDMVQYLTECIDQARIKPNSYFLTHLLYAELRKQNIGAVWRMYLSMRSANVQPDLETFACLWDTGKIQYDRARTAYSAEYPTARGLYQEMMQWYSKLTPTARKITQEEFSKDLYDQITRCFCLEKDLPGTVAALHAMKETFGFSPDGDTARLLMIQVARAAPVPAGTPKSRRRRFSTTPRSKENLEQISRLLDALTERKENELALQDMTADDLSEEQQKEFQLELMSEMLRIVLRRILSHSAAVEENIRAAAVEMGLPQELNLGQPIDEDF